MKTRPAVTWIAHRHARYIAAVDGNPRRAARLLLIACGPLAPCAALFFAHIRAGLEDLLPADSPAVRAIEVIHSRFAGRASLIIVATSPDAEANRGFIATLGARLEERHIREVRRVQAGCSDERQWLLDHAPLLMAEDAFGQLVDSVDTAIDSARRAANPFFVDLADPSSEDDETRRHLFADIDARVHAADRFPSGQFEGEAGHLVLAMVWLDGSETERAPADRLLRAVRREVEILRPQFRSDLRVSFTGEVMSLVEECDAIAEDLAVSSAIVLVLVSLLIVGYFRSLRALAVVLCGLAPGLLVTFFIGLVTIGHVNSNTGFLGSIIAGNGINYPILFLAYYRGTDPRLCRRVALVEATRRALPGTLGAALTATAAYGALAASSFRGFSQFGWLGGAGMLCVWCSTFLVMPIAIALIDPPRATAVLTATQARLARYFDRPLWPTVVAGGFVVISLAVAGAGVRFALDHGVFDMNLRNLASRASLRSGSQSWGPRVMPIFGVWLSATTAVVDDPADEPALARSLSAALVDQAPRLAARLEGIDQLVPPRAQQERRIARRRRIGLAWHEVPQDRVPARLRSLFDAWFSDEKLSPIQLADLPAGLTATLAERDGRVDRAVVIYPRHDVDFNDARNVIHFADRIREARLPRGATVGGSFVLMAELFRVVSSESARVVVVACLLVATLLVPLFAQRPLRIPLVTLVVALVALVSQAQMLALGVQINMINFAATPITIGVGADYLINLFAAMDALSVDARRACARMGGAILLCSLTTMIGYASLLLAESGALRTFGWAAALGEWMAVATVLLVVPAVWPRQVRAGATALESEAVS